MIKILVNIYLWENPRLFGSNFRVKEDDKVIIPMENSNEIGVVLKTDVKTKDNPQEKIIRIATERDKIVYQQHEKEKSEFIKHCRKKVKELELSMKIIDARISLDGKQVIFIFTADGRVDFRSLVKNISRDLKKLIRMQQIGSRDEARKLGGYGICGRELCCVKFPGSIPSITTDMARVQQIAHRGSERMSGLCGRLMCCLAYEAEQYKKMLEGMPELYSIVDTKEGKGTVVEIIVPTQEIKVKTQSGKYLILKKEDFK